MLNYRTYQKSMETMEMLLDKEDNGNGIETLSPEECRKALRTIMQVAKEGDAYDVFILDEAEYRLGEMGIDNDISLIEACAKELVENDSLFDGEKSEEIVFDTIKKQPDMEMLTWFPSGDVFSKWVDDDFPIRKYSTNDSVTAVVVTVTKPVCLRGGWRYSEIRGLLNSDKFLCQIPASFRERLVKNEDGDYISIPNIKDMEFVKSDGDDFFLENTTIDQKGSILSAAFINGRIAWVNAEETHLPIKLKFILKKPV